MKDSRMLYKHPGKYYLHGDWYDYKIVSESDVDQHLSDGWHLTTTDARAAAVAAKSIEKKKARRKLKDLTPIECQQILDSTKSYKELADIYVTSVYAIKKIKGGG